MHEAILLEGSNMSGWPSALAINVYLQHFNLSCISKDLFLPAPSSYSIVWVACNMPQTSVDTGWNTSWSGQTPYTTDSLSAPGSGTLYTFCLYGFVHPSMLCWRFAEAVPDHSAEYSKFKGKFSSTYEFFYAWTRLL